MRMLHLALLAALLLPAPARADSAPVPHPGDGMALLGRLGPTYRALTSYHYEGTLSVRMSGAGPEQAMEMPLVMAGDRQGRLHLDVRNPQMGALLLSDGRQLTTFVYSLNQYTQKPGEAPQDSAGLPAPPPNSPMARYFDPLQSVRAATLGGTEAITVGGRAIDCWVVRAENSPPPQLAADTTARSVTTFWVDRERTVVLRDSTHVSMRNPGTGAPVDMTQVTRYDRVRVDEPLPDSLFVFTPPAGADLVQQLGPAEAEPPLVGKPAPPFTLKGVKGSTVSLASYKGKVVLLDFWATWCKPCRIEMPEIEKIYKEFKPKGLVVFGVNQGEDLPTVRRFLAESPYSFPILLDPKTEAGGKYQAEAIPTLVIIGKDGKVSSYFRGLRSGEVIREALAKAGVK